MILIDVIESLGSLDEASTIYASKPWTKDSEVVVMLETNPHQLLPLAQQLGLNYFLEVSIAREFLEGWSKSLDAEPTTQAKCERLIHYAINDA
jgi:hypothetical protein